MTAAELKAMAGAAVPTPCSECAAFVCPGWESLGGDFDRTRLRRVGTLRAAGDDEPTLAEYHPGGTHGWSAEAPIALGYFPYNRCDVWQCVSCGRAFLRYTEYGGYYVDERIRQLDPALIVEP